ncbi:MAG: putative rRNA methyltransferase [Verrucomicrobiaceae bacterium]|nr:putative rRNA methyltransferase [Verrucomicrobiaceae bacterium]
MPNDSIAHREGGGRVLRIRHLNISLPLYFIYPMTSDHFALPTAVDWSHWLLQSRVQPGDWVVDATAGNGHDSLFLAGLVGAAGRVFVFDVQETAIVATRRRLEAAGVLERCELIHAGHEHMSTRLPEDSRGQLTAVMFNLGWLPGHDKKCITNTETTMSALVQALESLRPGGLLTVVVYPGHAGGDEESQTIAVWASALASNTHEVRHTRSPNRQKRSPECWAIRKRQTKPDNQARNSGDV